MKRYVYFFTRQDLTPEQQLVQTAHAAFKLGSVMRSSAHPDETYFVCVGVRNLDGLKAIIKILTKFRFGYERFVEPDLNGGELTAVAVHPVDEDKRDVLLSYNLLVFK